MTTTRRRQHQQFNRLRRIALGLFVLAVLEAVVITILAVNCTSGAAPAPEETAPVPTAEISVPETEAPIASIPDEPVTEPESVPQETEGQKFLHSDDIPLSYELQEVMQQACEDYGVPYALALAIAECESSFDLDADNGTCWGLMQIHPINYAQVAFPLPYVRSRRIRAGLQGRGGEISELRLSGVSGPVYRQGHAEEERQQRLQLGGLRAVRYSR